MTRNGEIKPGKNEINQLLVHEKCDTSLWKLRPKVLDQSGIDLSIATVTRKSFHYNFKMVKKEIATRSLSADVESQHEQYIYQFRNRILSKSNGLRFFMDEVS